jgi:DNA-binding XRE family transcriptional regulator
MNEDEIIRERVRLNLITYRTAMGWTQEQLAEKVERKKTTIASWEQGKAEPSLEMLWKLSKLFGKNIAEMYGE